MAAGGLDETETGAEKVIKERFTFGDIAEATGKNKSTIIRRAKKEGWPFKEVASRGGKIKEFDLAVLPAEYQRDLARRYGLAADTPGLCVSAALASSINPQTTLSPREGAGRHASPPSASANGALSIPPSRGLERWAGDGPKAGPAAMQDERTARIARILSEAEAAPKGMKKSAWLESVAVKHGITRQTIYKWMKKYQAGGLAGLKHTKSTKGAALSWDQEALDFWIGLCLKRQHRKMSRKALYYNVLTVEAARRGWKLGSLRSAYEKYDQLVTPCLKSLQSGGVRALDNNLPPVLRSYADLKPFQLLVGDQHKFDFWVVDEESGEAIRPEGYFWQDLRTRNMYGGAVGRKYDSQMIGLALRLGIRIWGPFGSVYTDNGKPELSKYIMGVLKDLRRYGMEVFREEANISEQTGLPAEEVNPALIAPGGHIRAIIKNAKAKMIEGTFNNLERILRDEFRVPGYVKKLGGPAEENDIDQAEIEALAGAGKLLTLSEFMLTVLKAMDFYNKEKPHRGVYREWAWMPKINEKQATPIACLKACMQHDGWQPRRMDPDALDLMFLPKAERKIQTGRISFMRRHWECRDVENPRALTDLNGEYVRIYYDPMVLSSLAVFHRGEFVCEALPAEQSSMINGKLAERKIHEKRRLRRLYIEEYQKLTSAVPDVRQFSQSSTLEKAAAVMGRQKKKRSAEQEELYRKRSNEELQADVAALEAIEERNTPVMKDLPKRPAYFLTETDRYAWAIRFESAGGELGEEDKTFMREYESTMSAEEVEMWEARRMYGGQ